MNNGLLEKLGRFLSGVRERPSHERKTMLVATFLATSALIFSFWANHMYNQFGLAFSNRYNSVPSQEYTTPTENSMESTEEDGELESPLAALWKNIGLIKEETAGLANEIRSIVIDAAALTQVSKDEDKKEPPIKQEDQEGQSELIKLSAKSEQSTILTTGSKEPPLVSLRDTNTEDAPNSLPEKKYVSAGVRKPGTMMEVDPSSETAAAITSVPKPPREKKGGLVSVFKYNFATIKQGMISFYEYLTQ